MLILLFRNLNAVQSWTPLQGTTTLLQVVDAARKGQTYAPEGVSVQSTNQLILTEDSIQVVDILLVSRIAAHVAAVHLTVLQKGQPGWWRPSVPPPRAHSVYVGLPSLFCVRAHCSSLVIAWAPAVAPSQVPV